MASLTGTDGSGSGITPPTTFGVCQLHPINGIIQRHVNASPRIAVRSSSRRHSFVGN